MNVDNYGWESSLSMIANEQTRTAVPRHGHGEVPVLLRPVFMNAVEVGYSYAHCDRDKKLNVRGVTIALWYFICRGHQAIALLPYCFKNYAEKSSRYSELMMLYRLNLIEFTPGYGTEKYAEVNRIMVSRAYETGGCLVARSQMQGITDNKSHLVDLVENRLLMPTFNGDDIMFPIDGPLGRNGPSLQQTLQCEQGSGDWRSCSEHQLLLSDQRHWLEKLALLVPEKVIWTRMTQLIQAGGTEDTTDYENEPPMPSSPPVDNPFHRSPSQHQQIQQISPSNSSINNDASSYQHQESSPPSHHHHQYQPHSPQQHHHLQNPHQFQQHHRRPVRRYYHYGHNNYHHYNNNHHHNNRDYNRDYNGNWNNPNGPGSSGSNGGSTRLLIRYGSSPPKVVNHHHHGGRYHGGGRLQQLQRMEHMKHSDTTESAESTDSTQSGEFESPAHSIEMDEDVALHPRDFQISDNLKFHLLVEKCINEPDQEGDGGEFADIWAPESSGTLLSTGTSSGASSEDSNIVVIEENLIDFSDPPLIPTTGPIDGIREIQGAIHQLVDLMF
ncbi:Protein CBG22527 [Caenorhabditis briggsae]|uniref:Protein CBG22527 n=1 Tax=Caenorhabditis briggsae TaxID=6238 RepID=A8Y2H3_CAEBR|nr:Protein CBG22527 [Caenorhabditis briggsae]CAP39095.2 Protein CBG22527 [Caenorhabditis briggsae]